MHWYHPKLILKTVIRFEPRRSQAAISHIDDLGRRWKLLAKYNTLASSKINP